jgi:hypothetical protein
MSRMSKELKLGNFLNWMSKTEGRETQVYIYINIYI